jgi:glutathione synthase/RimK-type ligase-like ATP-grasp enzyme
MSTSTTIGSAIFSSAAEGIPDVFPSMVTIARVKRIAVYFDDPGFESYPFDKEEYRTAYHELGTCIVDRGAAFHIARGQDTFIGKGEFIRGWVFQNGIFVECGPFKADVVYDKGYFKTDGSTQILNDRELDAMCTDKWKTAEAFPKASPKTFRANSVEDLRSAVTKIGGGMIVAKPIDGEEGEGVVIAPAHEIERSVHQYPYLVQEFIDTSDGIPGLVDGMHDLRIVSVAGQPMLCYIRTPPKGEFRANVSRGGSEIEVPINTIPEEALRIFRMVDASFSRFSNRVYSVDMGRDRDGSWKIIELNSKPGLKPSRFGPEYAHFLERLADTLISS